MESINIQTSIQEIRLRHNGAYIKGNQYFCSIHPLQLIDEEGDCDGCQEADAIIGVDYAEARAEQTSQEIFENDNFFEPDYIKQVF